MLLGEYLRKREREREISRYLTNRYHIPKKKIAIEVKERKYRLEKKVCEKIFKISKLSEI